MTSRDNDKFHKKNEDEEKDLQEDEEKEPQDDEEIEQEEGEEASVPAGRSLQDSPPNDPILILVMMHQNEEDQKYYLNWPFLWQVGPAREVPLGEGTHARAPPGQGRTPARGTAPAVARMPTHAREDDYYGLNSPPTGDIQNAPASRKRKFKQAFKTTLQEPSYDDMISLHANQKPSGNRVKDPPVHTGHLDPDPIPRTSFHKNELQVSITTPSKRKKRGRVKDPPLYTGRCKDKSQVAMAGNVDSSFGGVSHNKSSPHTTLEGTTSPRSDERNSNYKDNCDQNNISNSNMVNNNINNNDDDEGDANHGVDDGNDDDDDNEGDDDDDDNDDGVIKQIALFGTTLLGQMCGNLALLEEFYGD